MYILYLPDLKSKKLLLVGINTSPAMYCISKLYTIVGCLDMSGADALCWLNNRNNTKQTRMLLTTFVHIQPLLYYIYIGACSIIVPTEPQHYTVHCIFPLLCLMYNVYMGHWNYTREQHASFMVCIMVVCAAQLITTTGSCRLAAHSYK